MKLTMAVTLSVVPRLIDSATRAWAKSAWGLFTWWFNRKSTMNKQNALGVKIFSRFFYLPAS